MLEAHRRLRRAERALDGGGCALALRCDRGLEPERVARGPDNAPGDTGPSAPARREPGEWVPLIGGECICADPGRQDPLAAQIEVIRFRGARAIGFAIEDFGGLRHGPTAFSSPGNLLAEVRAQEFRVSGCVHEPAIERQTHCPGRVLTGERRRNTDRGDQQDACAHGSPIVTGYSPRSPLPAPSQFRETTRALAASRSKRPPTPTVARRTGSESGRAGCSATPTRRTRAGSSGPLAAGSTGARVADRSPDRDRTTCSPNVRFAEPIH